MKNNTSLEEQILAAAEELFIQKGFTETSTTDIAKKVGCNQALVHYYFRTKDNLFEQIFLQKVEFALSCADSYRFNGNFKELITTMITNYFKLLDENRKLPFFVLNELIINDKRRELIKKHIIENRHRQKIYYALDQIVQNESRCGHIRPIETLDLLLNIVALTISTFIFLPIYADWLQKNEEEQTAFIEHRKNVIINLIMTDLEP
ncbi:MAG: TetR/AcrR family transcriptional regulator [Paludibacteraceae bacterium]